jgi:hypothetical protein
MKKNNTEPDKSYSVISFTILKTENEEICLFTIH